MSDKKYACVRGLGSLVVAAMLLLFLSSCGGGGNQGGTGAEVDVNNGEADADTDSSADDLSTNGPDSGNINGSDEDAGNGDGGTDNSEADIVNGNFDSGITRLSFTENQEELNDHVTSASRFDITDDGRYLLFATMATNVVEDDGLADTFTDVYLRDTVSGSVTKISRAIADAVNTGQSFAESISDDGRFATFTTVSTGIHPDANGSSQIYLYDALSDSIELISRDAAGEAGRGNSFYSFISSDGGTVIFTSRAANIVSDFGGVGRVIVAYDVQSGTLSGVGNTGGDVRDISSDARYVLFRSDRTYVFDRQTQSLIEVENADAFDMAISDDGRYVAFTRPPTNTVTRVDLQLDTEVTMGLNALVPQDANTDLNRLAKFEQMSGDGQSILYYGVLYDGDVPARSETLHWNVYAINMSDPDAILISRRADQSNQQSNPGGDRMSLHSQFFNEDKSVLFYSEASDLVTDDGNFRGDLFSAPLVLGE